MTARPAKTAVTPTPAAERATRTIPLLPAVPNGRVRRSRHAPRHLLERLVRMATLIEILPAPRFLNPRRWTPPLSQMLPHLLPIRVVILLLILPLLSGCIHATQYEELRLLVTDVGGSQPLTGVTIQTSPHKWPFRINTQTHNATTDEHGRATILAAPRSFWRISRDGYLDGNTFSDFIDEPNAVPYVYRVTPGSPEHAAGFDAHVQLYSKPSPTVTLVLPDGYRGVVTLTLIPSDPLIAPVPRNHHFTFEADEDGFATGVATWLIFDHWSSRLPGEVSFRYRGEGDNSIPHQPDHPAEGLPPGDTVFWSSLNHGYLRERSPQPVMYRYLVVTTDERQAYYERRRAEHARGS